MFQEHISGYFSEVNTNSQGTMLGSAESGNVILRIFTFPVSFQESTSGVAKRYWLWEENHLQCVLIQTPKHSKKKHYLMHVLVKNLRVTEDKQKSIQEGELH